MKIRTVGLMVLCFIAGFVWQKQLTTPPLQQKAPPPKTGGVVRELFEANDPNVEKIIPQDTNSNALAYGKNGAMWGWRTNDQQWFKLAATPKTPAPAQ